MRAVKAKALRRVVGFHPADRVDYSMDTVKHIKFNGNPFPIVGTIRAVGKRREYQDAKRILKGA